MIRSVRKINESEPVQAKLPPSGKRMTKGIVIPSPGAWDGHLGLRSPGHVGRFALPFLVVMGVAAFFTVNWKTTVAETFGSTHWGIGLPLLGLKRIKGIRSHKENHPAFIHPRTLPECLLCSRCWLGAGASARLTKKHTVPAHMALGPIVEEASLDLSSRGVGAGAGVRSVVELRFPDAEKQCFSYLSGRRLGGGNLGEGLGSWQDKGPQPKYLSQRGLLGIHRQRG